jgi:acetylglutamate synthase
MATAADKEFVFDLQKLRSKLDGIHDKSKSSSESGSALTQARNQAAEALGCHKKALSICEDIDKMSDDKLSDFMRSFLPMFEGLCPEWMDRIQDMVDKAEAQTADMEGSMG